MRCFCLRVATARALFLPFSLVIVSVSSLCISFEFELEQKICFEKVAVRILEDAYCFRAFQVQSGSHERTK